MIGKLLTVMFLTLSLISVSCASRTLVNPEPVNIQSAIKEGDYVKIITKDNKKIDLIVVEVTDEAIVGESETVLFADITKLQEQTVRAGESIPIITIVPPGWAAEGFGKENFPTIPSFNYFELFLW